MQTQEKALDIRIRDTLNKVTREKMALARLRKSLAQEFDWPVEELLRQLKGKMDADVAEIQGQVQQMQQARSLLGSIMSYQEVLRAQVEHATRNTRLLNVKLEEEAHDLMGPESSEVRGENNNGW
jgi:fructose-1,6-bisphosphatase